MPLRQRKCNASCDGKICFIVNRAVAANLKSIADRERWWQQQHGHGEEENGVAARKGKGSECRSQEDMARFFILRWALGFSAGQ